MSAPESYAGEFLRCVVGSTVNGLSTGSGDLDLMGIRIEEPDKVIGLGHFEQHTWRSQPEGVQSGPGDTDLTCYGLRKWMRLAIKGNPSILLLLFVPPEYRLTDEDPADGLRAMTPYIVSRAAASQFLGYLTAQKARLLGERGGRRVTRPLNEEGYDGKYACHMVRLGMQGVELMSTGAITLPMPDEDREYCLSIRRGEVPLDEILTRTGLLEVELSVLRTHSPLQATPDLEAVNEFLFETYLASWKS